MPLFTNLSTFCPLQIELHELGFTVWITFIKLFLELRDIGASCRYELIIRVLLKKKMKNIFSETTIRTRKQNRE